MYTSEMNRLDVNRLKAFIRGIVIARKKISEKNLAREELREQIVKVKRLAEAKKPSAEKLKSHVAEIENKINNVLQKEAKLLRSSAYENKTIAELRKKINDMEQEISIKDAEKRNLLRLSQDSVKKLNETTDVLKQKIESYIGEKTDRERRMQELEEKIRVKSEVLDRIAKLELKYKELEERENYDEDDLAKIKQRIDQLKTSL